jgi:hypothetical protein
MANNSELVNNIKNYLELDKEIEQLNSKTTELRKKRGIYEERLVADICRKKLDNKMLTVSKDLGLVCQQNKVLPNLTLDIVKMALNEKISNRDTVNSLIKHISAYREKNRKTDYVIKKRKPGRRSFRKKKL